jgi:hypothetical protein
MNTVFQAASKAFFFIVRGPSLGSLGREICEGSFTYTQVCRKSKTDVAKKEFTNEEEAVKWAMRKRMALYTKKS